MYKSQIQNIDMVIYHSWCPDGITSSWPFWRENKNIIFIGCTFGQTPPNVHNMNIFIVDFSFPRSTLIKMAQKAKSIYVLDHHISSERDLQGLDLICKNLYFIFDVNRSGCQIVWDFVYPTIKRPWFVNVVADRDLWNWRLPYSKAVSKALSAKGYYTWSRLEELYNSSTTEQDEKNIIDEFTQFGQILIQQEDKEISSICSRAVLTEFSPHDGKFYRVKLVSCSSNLRSDVGNRLAGDNCDFAALWTYDFILDEWWVSLRGTKHSNIDLSAICSTFLRGGGHKNAAGFAIRGIDNETLHTYFRILELPRSRLKDREFVFLD